MYNYAVYTLLILVLDLPGMLLPDARRCTDKVPPDDGRSAHAVAGWPVVLVRCGLACLGSMLGVYILLVGLCYHRPEDDPKWPMTAVAMYSTAGCGCHCGYPDSRSRHSIT
eukprot:gnl/TRDRNA2_/TRDRNA2_147933_c1_seq1.p1 gnl/TRDRNA2_/TRDRNA2_147933_c1~~gnl/TRDRNA2_/TRDRNA2_147933_c1_seq1.p1  ORF type:complete len:111 (+),score=9.85 gnl/TRDRNA2_/TRDRNA2_147933_c1_seq1:102-434(+)